MRLQEAIASRRSVRRLSTRPVPPELVEQLVATACTAPAPHHSRPWRFVRIAPETRATLAAAMAEAWRRDLLADGVPEEKIRKLTARSERRITTAPVLLLACLTPTEARPWPDGRRRAAERDMFVQSLGASLQNLMLAAHAAGLGSYLMGAPLFCADAVAAALQLPAGLEPAFLVALGYPADGFTRPPRPEIRAEDFLIDR
ncbi:MAG: nitroreductase family protein [Chloroflexi bacterium]|nr:nitroreductase family protein [Chloroflexota bacterium]